jgi:hypothetical protein
VRPGRALFARAPALAAVAITIAVAVAVAACGAEGVDAPLTPSSQQTCPGVDDRLANVLATLRAGELDDLHAVLDRLATERDGVRLERAMQFGLRLLQALPRREAESFEYALVYTLLDRIREPAVGVLRFLAEGPAQRRAMFAVLGDMFAECARDSLILTVKDLFDDTDLLEAAGAALSDEAIVGLLANIPSSEQGGRAGFVALIRATVNAIRSPSFDFAQLRDLLSFLELDEPPLSGLLDALQAYLTGERLANLRATLSCLATQGWRGAPGVDVLGGFLFDVMTLEGLDLGELLELAAPILEQLKEPTVETLLTAVIDELLEDVGLRDLGLELVVFFLREDNLQSVLRATVVLFENRGIDDVLRLIEGLTVRCTGERDATGGDR